MFILKYWNESLQLDNGSIYVKFGVTSIFIDIFLKIYIPHMRGFLKLLILFKKQRKISMPL